MINKTYKFDDRLLLVTGDVALEPHITFCIEQIASLYPDVPKKMLISPLHIRFQYKNGIHDAHTMYVHPSEPNVINVVGNLLEMAKNESEKFQETVIQWAFIHEYIHLFHEQTSRMLSKAYERRERLHRSLETVSINDDWGKVLLVNRHNLEILKSLLLLEGVASFCQVLNTKEFLESLVSGKRIKVDGLEAFDEYYRDAAKASYKLNTNFELLLEVHRKQSKSLEQIDSMRLMAQQHLRFLAHVEGEDPYAIGLHMVFTILTYAKEITFVNLLEIEPAAFLRLYEECIKYSGKTPVISNTSGKGMFDFARAQQELLSAFKDKQ